MVSPDYARAVPAAQGGDPREHDRAEELIWTEKPSLSEPQQAYVEGRFLLLAPTACTVADLYVGRAA